MVRYTVALANTTVYYQPVCHRIVSYRIGVGDIGFHLHILFLVITESLTYKTIKNFVACTSASSPLVSSSGNITFIIYSHNKHLDYARNYLNKYQSYYGPGSRPLAYVL